MPDCSDQRVTRCPALICWAPLGGTARLTEAGMYEPVDRFVELARHAHPAVPFRHASLADLAGTKERWHCPPCAVSSTMAASRARTRNQPFRAGPPRLCH